MHRALLAAVCVLVQLACAARTDAEAQAAGNAASAPVASTASSPTPVQRVFNPSSPAAATAPAMTFRGALEQGGLLIGKVEPGSRIFLDERPLRVAPDGTVVFGLDRDAPEKIHLRVQRPDGVSLATTYEVKPREYAIQRVTGISERVMNPNPEDERRITEEAALAGKARERDDDRLDFLQPFTWPATGPITGVYGSQRYYNGVPKRPHYGVDVGVPTGTDVVAPAAGIVTLAHPDMFYSGGTLIIDHGHGVSSTLMHLSQVLVKVGERVERGQRVAKSGASGRASGPHLDWRMNWFDRRIDPQRLVPPMPSPAK